MALHRLGSRVFPQIRGGLTLYREDKGVVLVLPHAWERFCERIPIEYLGMDLPPYQQRAYLVQLMRDAFTRAVYLSVVGSNRGLTYGQIFAWLYDPAFDLRFILWKKSGERMPHVRTIVPGKYSTSSRDRDEVEGVL